MTNTENPRAVVGDNTAVNYGERIAEQMKRDYAELVTGVGAALEAARGLPVEISTDEDLAPFASLIKRMRDTVARIEAFRVAEKEPHLRAEQAVDSFFFSLTEKLSRRKRDGRAGAADILQARVDAYQQRKLAEERERLRKAAEDAAREEHERRVAEAKALQAAEEARKAAERARKPENVEQRTEVAQEKAGIAASARLDTFEAATAAENAAVAAARKSADIARVRLPDAMVTMRQVPHVEVIDRDLVDKSKLWPFLKDDHIALALRAWAKTTNHKQKMDGALIEMRDESVIL